MPRMAWLINLHPVFGSVEDGFELCQMYGVTMHALKPSFLAPVTSNTIDIACSEGRVHGYRLRPVLCASSDLIIVIIQ